MFFLKNKLHQDLVYSLENNLYKYYRVNIFCNLNYKYIEKKLHSSKHTVFRVIPILGVICALLSPKSIERFIEYPEVSHISIDTRVALCNSAPSSSAVVDLYSKYTLSGKGIDIGLIDSGIFPHPDLTKSKHRIKTFLDLTNGLKYPYDDLGHGTCISGIIGGDGYSSKGRLRGLAPDVTFHSVKAFDNTGSAYISDVLYALNYFAVECLNLNIKVICLPLQILNNDKTILSCFSLLFEHAAKNKISIVIPGESRSMTGASVLKNCITTAASYALKRSNQEINVRTYSQCSIIPAATVQCMNVNSLNTNTNYISERDGLKLFPPRLEKPYITCSGASLACGYISGVCALLLEKNPSLSVDDICALLKISVKKTKTDTNFDIFDLPLLLSSI